MKTRFLALLILALVLTGCGGFQLRGSQPLPPSMSPLLITGLNQYSDLYRQLEYQFTANGIRLTRSRDAAASILKMTAIESQDKLTAIDRRGKGVEYLLIERAIISLYDSAGKELVAERQVAVDHYRYALDSEQLASARAREEKEREMQDLLAQEIIRSLHYSMRTGSE